MDPNNLETLQRQLAVQMCAALTKAVQLTTKEQEAISFLFRGFSAKEHADFLGTTTQTIKNFRSRAYRKLGVADAQQLIAQAYKNGGLQLWTYTGRPQGQIWHAEDPTPEPQPDPPPTPPKHETAAERMAWMKLHGIQRDTAGLLKSDCYTAYKGGNFQLEATGPAQLEK